MAVSVGIKIKDNKAGLNHPFFFFFFNCGIFVREKCNSTVLPVVLMFLIQCKPSWCCGGWDLES